MEVWIDKVENDPGDSLIAKLGMQLMIQTNW